MIDQIFDQLDEENNGHISSIKLLGIIKSLEDSTSSELMDLKDLRSEVAETFSSSPPLCPEYEDQDNIQLVLSNLNTNLYRVLTMEPDSTKTPTTPPSPASTWETDADGDVEMESELR